MALVLDTVISDQGQIKGTCLMAGLLQWGEWFFIIPKLHSNIIILLDLEQANNNINRALINKKNTADP